MKRFLVAASLFAVACLPKDPVAQRSVPATVDSVMAGGKLFRAHCSECHGSDGIGGGHAPSLRSVRVAEMSDARLFNIITNGNLRRGMPSWSRLPEERRWQIVTFLHSLKADAPASGR